MVVRSLTSFELEPATPTAKSYTLVDPGIGAVFGATPGSPRRGARNIGAFYRQSGTLRGPIDRIVNMVAQLGLQTYRVKRASGPTAKAKGQEVRRAIKANKGARDEHMKRGEIEAVDHPALALLQRPQVPVGRLGPLTQQTLIEVLVADLLLYGEFFVWNIGTGLGSMRAPTQLEPIPAPWVRASGGRRGSTWEVEGPEDLRMAGLTAEQLAWVRHPDPSDPHARATGIAMTLADELDTDESAAQYANALFRNGGVPGVVVSLEGGPPEAKHASTATSVTAAKRFEEDFRQRFGAVRKAGGIYVHDGAIDIKQTSYSPVDLNTIEMRREIFAKVLQILGMPPELMGVLDNSNRATITVSREIAAEVIVAPIVSMLESWLNDLLLPLFDPTDDVFFAFESPMPDDIERKDKLRTVAPWAPTLDEWREEMGLPVMADERAGKSHALPTSVVIVSEEGIAAEADRSEEEPEDPNDPNDPNGADPESDPEDDKKALTESLDLGGARVKALDQLQIERAISRIQAVALRRRMTPIMRRELAAWIMRVVREVGVQIPQDVLASLAGAFLADFSSARITMINDHTMGSLRRSLALAVRQGKSKEDIARNIQRIMKVSDSRARTIARTEVHRATSWAEYHVHKLSGVVIQRQWVVIPDKRLRDAHAGMAGQVQKMADPFVAPGGEQAFYPTGFSVAKLDINCRCRAVPITASARTNQRTMKAEWVKAESLELGFRRRMAVAIRAGFAEQLDAVKAALAEEG